MFDTQTTADVITLLYPNSNLIIRIHHHSETKELWFVASDVCKILQLSNASHFVSKLDKSHVIKYKVLTSSGTQSVLWVDVQGAQSLANVVHTKTTKDFLHGLITYPYLSAINLLITSLLILSLSNAKP